MLIIILQQSATKLGVRTWDQYYHLCVTQFLHKVTECMGSSTANRNCANHYRIQIYHLISDNQGRITFFTLLDKTVIIIKTQEDIPKFLCSLFENLVKFHQVNQGVTTLAVAPQMRPHTKNISINYYHLCSFIAIVYVSIKNIDTKKQVKHF